MAKYKGVVDHIPSDQTRNIVKVLTAAGDKQEIIARALGISKPTLRKHYRPEIDTSFPLAKAQVVSNLFRIATSRTANAATVTAAIFMCKTKFGFNDRAARLEITGPDGGPVETVATTIIKGTMTPKEAADAYQRTLREDADSNVVQLPLKRGRGY